MNQNDYSKMLAVGAKIVGKEVAPMSGNTFNVSATDPRLERLGISPESVLGGNGLTEEEVSSRMMLLEMREAANLVKQKEMETAARAVQLEESTRQAEVAMEMVKEAEIEKAKSIEAARVIEANRLRDGGNEPGEAPIPVNSVHFRTHTGRK